MLKAFQLWLLLFHFPMCLLARHRHNKRQFINDAVQIDRWSGPFFNEDDQANAFKQLVNGDVTGTKRMELEGIDPSRILNPLPIKEKKKVTKDEGPVAETYIGSNPYPDKITEASPQERLANLISEPIIHNEPFQNSNKRNKEHLHHQSNGESIFGSKNLPSNFIEEKHDMKTSEIDYNRSPSYMKSDMAEKKPMDLKDSFEQKGEYKLTQVADFKQQNREQDDYPRKTRLINNYMEPRAVESRVSNYEENRGDNNHHSNHNYDMPERKDSDYTQRYEEKNDMFFERSPDYKSYMFHAQHHDNKDDDDSNPRHTNMFNDNDPTKGIPDRPIVEEDNSFNNLETHRDPPGFPNEVRSETDEPTEKMISQFEEKDQKDYADAMKYNHNNDDDDNDGHSSENKRSNILKSNKKIKKIASNKKHRKRHFTKSKNKNKAKKYLNTVINSAYDRPTLGQINKIESPDDTSEGIREIGNIKSNNMLTRVPVNDDAIVANSLVNGEAVFNDKSSNTQQKLDDETIYLHHSKLHSKDASIRKISKNKSLNKRSHSKKSTALGVVNKRSHKKRKATSKGTLAYKRNYIKKPINSSVETGESKRWGPPHSHSMEHQNGFLEENAGENFHNPRVMTVGQSEATDVRKDWNNIHSPGNGFYNGVGVGPARISETEYLGHHTSHEPASNDDYVDASSLINPLGQVGSHVEGVGTAPGHGLFGDDAVHSLTASESHADRDTAGIIDAIWEHDYENHGSHSHARRKEGILGFFGHSDQNALLPAETLDGIAEHWEHIGHHSNSGMYTGGEALSQPTAAHSAEEHERIGAIQDIQDDPSIDNELQTMGIGMPLNGGHHHRAHARHHAQHPGVGMPYMESHEVSRLGEHYHPSVDEFIAGHGNPHIPPDVTRHNDMTADEYHNHINRLMLKYHQLEEDMKGQHGALMDHLDESMLHHHGHPAQHTGYDLYAYKNPWDNARLPYHVPVENHPDGSVEKQEPLEVPGIEAKGPLVEAKEPPVEAKEEEAKAEAKPDEKPVEAKAEAKEEPKKEAKEKSGDWSGDTPKVPPSQRGGPEKSGSIGLTSNNTLISEAIQKNIKEGDPASLKQAIFAYKSLNMTVPPNLEIEELKEELKEAQDKAKAAEAASIKPQPASIETHVSQVLPLASQAALLPAQALAIPSLPSSKLHEAASVKTKEPEKTTSPLNLPTTAAAQSNSAVDVTKILENIKDKSPLLPAQNSLNIPSMQQLNSIAQQAYLKEMLLNAANLAKQTQKSVEHEKEATLVQPAVKPAQSNEKESLLQQAQILAFLQGMQQKPKADVSVPSAQPTQIPNIVSLIPKTDSKANSLQGLNLPGVQGAGISNILKQMLLSKPRKQNVTTATVSSSVPTTTSKSADENDDTPSLDVPDDDPSSNSKGESKQDAGDLVSILNSAGLLKKHNKHHKKKAAHKTAENAYARIGYEQAANDSDGYKVGSKKDTDVSSDATAPTTGVENASDSANPKLDAIENSSDADDEEETSKKNKIKNKGKKNVVV